MKDAIGQWQKTELKSKNYSLPYCGTLLTETSEPGGFHVVHSIN
jgi:hypothetical protein